jgi:hypothetical protein
MSIAAILVCTRGTAAWSTIDWQQVVLHIRHHGTDLNLLLHGFNCLFQVGASSAAAKSL